MLMRQGPSLQSHKVWSRTCSIKESNLYTVLRAITSKRNCQVHPQPKAAKTVSIVPKANEILLSCSALVLKLGQ